MGRTLKYLLRLAILAVLGLVAYTLLAELPPPTETVEIPLEVPPATEQPDAASGG